MLSIVSTDKEGKFQFKTFLHLIRGIFPRWDFFDQIAYSFHLEFKVPNSNQWEPIHFHQPRKAFSLFVSPHVNMALAEVNVIEHFAQDIQRLQSENPLIHSQEVQGLTSFKLLKSILNEKLKEYQLPASSIQFKIVASNPNEALDLYISDWIYMEFS